MNIAKPLLVLVTLSIISWVVYTFLNTYSEPKHMIQGEIDASTYSISSKLAGRIEKIHVKKGDMVHAGDLIFSIHSPEVEAKLKQATAAKGAAAAQKLQANNGARKEQIQAAHDQYNQAKAAEELLLKTYQRIEKLYNDGVVSEQKRDEIYTKYKASSYQSNAAKSMYTMAKEGARDETKLAATQQEKVYEGKVDEVTAYIKEQNQYAFVDGEVSQILIKEGELSPSGFPIVSITDIKDSWAKFFIREDYLYKFNKDTLVKVQIPALHSNTTYLFKVSYISVMGEYATFKAVDASKNFDLKSFEVHLTPENEIENLRVGMSVLIEM